MSKLLNLDWINNKVLLENTGNYTQYPMINHNKKRIFLIEENNTFKKECIKNVYTAANLVINNLRHNIRPQNCFLLQIKYLERNVIMELKNTLV